MLPILEISLEGLPGPTHHFGGLAYGNLHAMAHSQQVSSPRRAALESLDKMALLLDLGVQIALMPPQPRPNWDFLATMGFTGRLDEAAPLHDAYTQDPHLFLAALSSSGMWTANAATITASRDSADGRVHITPANLISQAHRATETHMVTDFFRCHMNTKAITIHDPLPAPFADEGAANLIRLEDPQGLGYYLFAYGRSIYDHHSPATFPARQTKEASQAIIRRHRLYKERTCLIQQHPQAIDAGVFHQDVIAFGQGQTLVVHEKAYLGRTTTPSEPDTSASFSPTTVTITDDEIPITDLIASYLCNSQMITSHEGHRVMLAPKRCQNIPSVRQWLETQSHRFADDIYYIAVEESLKNGGGPACLRLRLPLTAAEWAQVDPAIKLTPDKLACLYDAVQKHYPDRLTPMNFLDPVFLEQCMAAQRAVVAAMR